MDLTNMCCRETTVEERYSSMVGSRLPTYIRVSDKVLDLLGTFVDDVNVDVDVDVGADGFL